jgi:hypothetical protein
MIDRIVGGQITGYKDIRTDLERASRLIPCSKKHCTRPDCRFLHATLVADGGGIRNVQNEMSGLKQNCEDFLARIGQNNHKVDQTNQKVDQNTQKVDQNDLKVDVQGINGLVTRALQQCDSLQGEMASTLEDALSENKALRSKLSHVETENALMRDMRNRGLRQVSVEQGCGGQDAEELVRNLLQTIEQRSGQNGGLIHALVQIIEQRSGQDTDGLIRQLIQIIDRLPAAQ